MDHDEAGLYAFVVDDEVVYVGKARVLHRRVRNYSRRAFREQPRAPRVAHSGMSDALGYGIEIKVFVKIMRDAANAAFFEAETILIREMRPIWKQTHLINEQRPDSDKFTQPLNGKSIFTFYLVAHEQVSADSRWSIGRRIPWSGRSHAHSPPPVRSEMRHQRQYLDQLARENLPRPRARVLRRDPDFLPAWRAVVLL